jgi:hypothetical protein
MGEDLLWAIRGGGGASFGVILPWKVNLAYAPTTLLYSVLCKTLEQGATRLVHKWKQLNNIYLILFIKGRIVFSV